MGVPNEKAFKAWKRADADRLSSLRSAAANNPFNDLSRTPSAEEIQRWQDANRKVRAIDAGRGFGHQYFPSDNYKKFEASK